MNSYCIMIYDIKNPDILICHVIDEEPDTWIAREMGDSWRLQGSVLIKDNQQRKFLEGWDGMKWRRVRV